MSAREPPGAATPAAAGHSARLPARGTARRGGVAGVVALGAPLAASGARVAARARADARPGRDGGGSSCGQPVPGRRALGDDLPPGRSRTVHGVDVHDRWHALHHAVVGGLPAALGCAALLRRRRPAVFTSSEEAAPSAGLAEAAACRERRERVHPTPGAAHLARAVHRPPRSVPFEPARWRGGQSVAGTVASPPSSEPELAMSAPRRSATPGPNTAEPTAAVRTAYRSSARDTPLTTLSACTGAHRWRP